MEKQELQRLKEEIVQRLQEQNAFAKSVSLTLTYTKQEDVVYPAQIRPTYDTQKSYEENKERIHSILDDVESIIKEYNEERDSQAWKPQG